VSKATNPRTRKSGNESTWIQPTREQIASLARQLYIERGCQEGRDAQNWLRAEQILRQQTAGQAALAEPQSGRKPEDGTKQRSSSQQS
jgi:hypothetical protein